MKWLNRLEEGLLVVMISLMTIITFANVISRYFLHASLSFTEEITTNLFAYSIFIGAALLARENGHLGFSLVTDFFPKKLKILAVFLVSILTIIFFALLFWFGIQMIQQQIEYDQMTPALGWPAWVMGLSIPLGALLCLIRFSEGFLKEYKKIKGVSR